MSEYDVDQLLADPDPYTLVARALWGLLEASPQFCALVKAGNRIKFDHEFRSPVKAEVSSADMPEVRIVITSSTPGPNNTSCSHRDTVKWEIQISTGDKRMTSMLFPLRWVIFRAMADASRVLLQTVDWHGEKFVKTCRPASVSDGRSQSDLNRGIVGWASLWAIETDLWFSTSSVGR